MKSKKKQRILALILSMVLMLSASISALAQGDVQTEASGTETTENQAAAQSLGEETVPETETPAEEAGIATQSAEITEESVEQETADQNTAEQGTTEQNTAEQEIQTQENPEASAQSQEAPGEAAETVQDGTSAAADNSQENTSAAETAPESEVQNTETQNAETQEEASVSEEQPAETTEETVTEETVVSEATELKQEFTDEDGNVTQTVTAYVPEGAFQAAKDQISMEVKLLNEEDANYIKGMMEEKLPEGFYLDGYVLYQIDFKVNGEITKPAKAITISMTGNELAVEDTKNAHVFYYVPEDPEAEGDEDQLTEVTQKDQLIKSLEESGQSTENIEDYDYSEIAVNEGNADTITVKGWESTIYGCYVEKEMAQEVTYEDDTVKVTVSADEKGIIPNKTTLQVVPISNSGDTKDQYKEVEKKLQEKAESEEYEIAGFLAYDISFVDKEGKEVEPDGEVRVSLEYKNAALPEGLTEEEAKEADVTMLHLEEDEKGKVQDVVDMAEKEQVEAIATTESRQVEKVAVKTESFSAYVIAWSNAKSSSRAAGTLRIEDDVIHSGQIQINPDQELQNEIEEAKENGFLIKYVWYKSINDGNFEEVQRNKVGDNFNIAEDGSWLNIALDDGSLSTKENRNSVQYRVALFINDEEVKTSDPYSVQYYDELQNGSFEVPDIKQEYDSSVHHTQISNDAYPEKIWLTTGEGTGDDKGHDIEIINDDVEIRTGNFPFYSWEDFKDTYSWYGEDGARAGHQFVELNCEAEGALYQDVMTIQGESLNYWLSHRARGDEKSSTREYDTMYVVIVPTETAKTGGFNDGEIDTQAEVRQLINNIKNSEGSNIIKDEENGIYWNKNTGEYVATYKSDDQKWWDYSVENGYIATSYMTRFFFVAGQTDTNDVTVGNFLDRVGFSQELPPANPEEFNLSITKKVNGLSQDEFDELKRNLTFTIEVKDSEGNLVSENEAPLQGEVIHANEFQWSGSGASWTGTYSLSNQSIAYGEIYNYTIKENEYDVTDCGWSGKVTVNGTESEEKDQGTAEIQSESSAKYIFENSYTSATKDINFTKVWDDADNYYGTRPTSIDIELTASITVGGEAISLNPETDLKIENSAVTLAPDNPDAADEWIHTWNDVPVYYTCEGERYLIEYSVIETSANGNYVYETGTAQEGDGSDYTPTVQNPAESGTNNAIAAVNALRAGGNNSNSQLGAPSHKKYISAYDPETDEYTLNLDVTGARGEAVGGADILFVIDISNSMEGTLLSDVKNLLNGETTGWGPWEEETEGIIDQIFEAGDRNEIAFVKFGTTAAKSQWYSSNNKGSAESYVDDLRTGGLLNGGTNWTDAMEKASDLMQNKLEDNKEKVVIFLSDGKPTYTNKDGKPDGDGNTTYNSYYDDASKVVNNSTSLKNTTFYSVYLTSNTYWGMQTFNNKLTIPNHDLKDGTDLQKALQDIMHLIIPKYKNVSITDTLSAYADFVSTDKTSVTVTKRSVNGKEEKLSSNQYEVSFGDKSVTVSLLNGAELDEGVTYTISFKIKPSDYAKAQYAENGYKVNGTVHKGDSETGDTSAEKDGFYSNDYGKTYVEYTITGETGSNKANYPKPVIQIQEPKVVTSSMIVRKVWAGDDNPQQPDSVQVALMQSKNGEEAIQKETTILNEDNNWRHLWSELETKDGDDTYEYSVKELNVPDNYTCEIAYTEAPDDGDGTLATITNTYDANKEDVNLYIANVLQFETLTVNKQWEGDDGHTDMRPNSLTINIANTVDDNTYAMELTPDSWSGSISVPKLATGNYTANEVNPGDGYEQTNSYYDPSSNTVTITNTLQTTSLTVNKVWNDGNLINNHNAITFILEYREKGSSDENAWQSYGNSYQLEEELYWTTTISDLPAYNEYRVVEQTPDGYISSVEENSNGFTITNTLKWSAFKVHTGVDTKYLEGAQFELKDSDGTVIATGKSKEDGTIQWTLGQDSEIQDIYHLEDGDYTIVETKAPDGYMIDEDGWTVTFTDGVLTKFDGKPVTADEEKGVVINLENEMLYELPETGGPGIFLYMIGGTLLLMAGSLMIYINRRRGGAEKIGK